MHQFAGRTFLEVERFDRHGLSGRSPVCSLSALSPALIGAEASNWPKAADRLASEKRLPPEELDTVRRLAWFGKLIANSDMHDGNLAFLPGLRVAPAYDMLPMAYAPLRGGELPAVTYQPSRPLPGERKLWLQAASAALSLWHAAARDSRITAAFREICADNAVTLADAIALEA